MRILYLAEKPSQATDIAKVIGIKKKLDGYIELSTGDVMTYARGHLLELAEPADYDEAWGKSWAWEHLPMIPAQWKMKPTKHGAKQLRVIRDLLKECSEVVIATDAGREGELIAREILEHCRFRGRVRRLWTSSLVAKDIKAALSGLKPGSETEPLFEAARARQHGDWLYGLSGTRAATLAARQRGQAFPLGRVQTPTLSLVVRRDLDIRNFKAQDYFELEANVLTEKGHRLKLMHAPDEKHRITDEKEALRRKSLAEGASAALKVERTKGSEAPPLPYSLPALQKDANRVLGLTAKKTLELAQALYEKKALTYPRTDCQYLAQSQVDEIEGTLAVIEKRFGAVVGHLRAQGVRARASVFDSAKLTDHHAIVPTTEFVAELSADEERLYRLVSERYLQMLGQDCLFDSTKVSMNANGVLFKTSGRTVTSPGWQSLRLTSSPP